MRLYASLYIVAFILVVVATMSLPYLGETKMTFLGNSLSDLGAQQTKGNWAVNVAFTCMSLATLIYGSFVLKQQWVSLAMLYFFGVSFGMAAIYQAAGLDQLTHYDYSHDALHALFLAVSGIAFVVLCITIFSIIKTRIHKAQTAIVLLISLSLYFLQLQLPEYKGLWHRLLFIICFGWLFYAFTSYNFEKNKRHFNKMKVYRNLKKKRYQDEK